MEIDALGGKTFRAHVDSVQAGSGAAFSLLPPENATGNYVKVVQRVPVKIVFDEPLPADHMIGPGLSVEPGRSGRVRSACRIGSRRLAAIDSGDAAAAFDFPPNLRSRKLNAASDRIDFPCPTRRIRNGIRATIRGSSR